MKGLGQRAGGRVNAAPSAAPSLVALGVPVGPPARRTPDEQRQHVWATIRLIRSRATRLRRVCLATIQINNRPSTCNRQINKIHIITNTSPYPPVLSHPAANAAVRYRMRARPAARVALLLT